MFYQGCVQDLRKNTLPRTNSHIVITMCYYPRGIKKECVDEFRNILAPTRELFKEWKEFERQVGHEKAFTLSRYEERFSLSKFALGYLKYYAELPKDTYFICQCELGERCHREMLLLTVQKKFNASVKRIFHTYPIFKKRINFL